MNYQKVYMNQIHSSSLLCQLAQMWRSQLVCDAYIRTGPITTKAHRVVLLAACPMLQSMEKASTGSHLEVRLTADIKQEAVNMFLQYLYEGFMLLTEDNVKDVEKVARLLQVDSVIKCCADFFKCLESKTGSNTYSSSKYKYTSYDMLEFRHVRATDLQKTVQDRLLKRASEIARPVSPTSKKQRLHRASPPPGDPSHSSFGSRADDTFSMSHSYGSNQQEPWDRVPRHGASAASMANVRGQGRFQQPSVIDIVEDSIELVHVDPGDGTTSQPPSQKGVAVSVASQMDNGPPNISIVSVTGNTGPPHGPPPGQHHSQRQHPVPSFHSTPNVSSTSHQSRQTSVSSSPSQPKSSDRSVISLTDPQISQITRELTHQLQQQEQASHSASSIRPPQLTLAPGLTSPHENIASSQQSQQRPPPQFQFSDRLQQSASKPFAAGSVRQVSGLHSGSSSTGSPSTVRPDRSPSLSGKSDSMDRPPSVEANKDSSKQKGEDSSTASSADLMSDITIIKVESGDEAPTKEHKDSGQVIDSGGQMSGDTTGGLDMHVDAPDDGETSGMQIRRIGDDGTLQEGDSDIEELDTTGDWGQDDNEDSSMSNDPNNPLGGFRGTLPTTSSGQAVVEPKLSVSELIGSVKQESTTSSLQAVVELNIARNVKQKMSRDTHGATVQHYPDVHTEFQHSPIYGAHRQVEVWQGTGSSESYTGFDTTLTAVDTSFARPVMPPDLAVSGISTGSNVPMQVEPYGMNKPFQRENRREDVRSGESFVKSEIFEANSKKGPVQLTGRDDLPGHRIVPNNIRNGKRCFYCQTHHIKTSGGWRVKTNYKCETCDVSLCASEVSERNCFHLYHVETFGEQILGHTH